MQVGAVQPEIDAAFAPPFQCLFEPKRYKVFYGGRGAGRSWGIARALLLLGQMNPIRVLCARELQNSISESVHKVLADQISALGLHGFYQVQAQAIIGSNGTEFIFSGIKNNVNKIRSFEGINYCWVEEANKVSQSSWGVLIPTIRREGSEIWISFNPELDEDYTYQRFVKDKGLAPAAPGRFGEPISIPVLESPHSFVVKMTYKDNPWFPAVLDAERLRDKERPGHEDYYLNVWEGQTLQMLEGAIFARELRTAAAQFRICSVPWEREVPVDTAWDLGRADQTCIWFFQKVAMQWRILNYYCASGHDIPHFLKVLQDKGYHYGTHWLPHDAKHQKLGMATSIEGQIRKVYPGRVQVVPRTKKTDSINAARIFLAQCFFDEDNCADGISALRHYRYKVVDGQLANEPLHDWASDGADAFATAALGAKRPRSEPDLLAGRFEKSRQSVMEKLRETASNLGWMG